jgi:hypothetical protein
MKRREVITPEEETCVFDPVLGQTLLIKEIWREQQHISFGSGIDLYMVHLFRCEEVNGIVFHIIRPEINMMQTTPFPHPENSVIIMSMGFQSLTGMLHGFDLLDGPEYKRSRHAVFLKRHPVYLMLFDHSQI